MESDDRPLIPLVMFSPYAYQSIYQQLEMAPYYYDAIFHLSTFIWSGYGRKKG